jgi:cell division protein FtsQ
VVFGPFRPELDGELPHIAGPVAATAAMLDKFNQSRVALGTGELRAVGLEMSARGGVRLALASGASVELGREDYEQRLGRFIAVWPKVPRPAGKELARADLRHANGFAIEWRAIPAPPPAAPTPPPAPAAAPAAVPPATPDASPTVPQNPEQPNA